MKIEIEWEINEKITRKDVADVITEIRDVLGQYGYKHRLREVTGEKS